MAVTGLFVDLVARLGLFYIAARLTVGYFVVPLLLALVVALFGDIIYRLSARPAAGCGVSGTLVVLSVVSNLSLLLVLLEYASLHDPAYSSYLTAGLDSNDPRSIQVSIQEMSRINNTVVWGVSISVLCEMATWILFLWRPRKD